MFSDACVAAAAGNDTETLGWLLDFGCPATTDLRESGVGGPPRRTAIRTRTRVPEE